MQFVDGLLLEALTSWLRLRHRASRELGQALAEYSLILTVIAVGVVVPTMLIFRDALGAGFASAAGCLTGSC